jgi:hypothetical protein
MRGKEFNQDNLYKGFKYLMSKGFDYDIAKSAIEKYGNLIVEDDSDDQGDED